MVMLADPVRSMVVFGRGMMVELRIYLVLTNQGELVEGTPTYRKSVSKPALLVTP